MSIINISTEAQALIRDENEIVKYASQKAIELYSQQIKKCDTFRSDELNNAFLYLFGNYPLLKLTFKELIAIKHILQTFSEFNIEPNERCRLLVDCLKSTVCQIYDASFRERNDLEYLRKYLTTRVYNLLYDNNILTFPLIELYIEQGWLKKLKGFKDKSYDKLILAIKFYNAANPNRQIKLPD